MSEINDINEKELTSEQAEEVAGGVAWIHEWTGTCPYCHKLGTLMGDGDGLLRCSMCYTVWRA